MEREEGEAGATGRMATSGVCVYKVKVMMRALGDWTKRRRRRRRWKKRRRNSDGTRKCLGIRKVPEEVREGGMSLCLPPPTLPHPHTHPHTHVHTRPPP